MLVLGLTAEEYRHEAQHGKAGHDSRGIGKPAELHDEQPSGPSAEPRPAIVPTSGIPKAGIPKADDPESDVGKSA